MSVRQEERPPTSGTPTDDSTRRQDRTLRREGLAGTPPSSLTVLIPAYDEEPVIGRVVEDVQEVLDTTSLAYEILVVDDGSADGTAQVAAAAGATVLRHPYNIGNGAAIKTGIRHARGEWLVMMDGDGQHAPEDIPRLLAELGPYDMVVGARNGNSETDIHRDVANQVYNWFATYVANHRIEDLTSGFRAIKTPIAKSFVNVLPNSYSYPTTLTLAILRSGFSLLYVPIATRRRVGRSKIRIVRDGVRFLMIILKIATLFAPLRVFIPVSIAMFLTGVGYGLFKVTILNTRYGPTSAMLMTVSIVIFMVGLVSEQITQLRNDRAESVVSERSTPHEERQEVTGR